MKVGGGGPGVVDCLAMDPDVVDRILLRILDGTYTHPLRPIPKNMDNFNPRCTGHTPTKISLDFENRSLRHF